MLQQESDEELVVVEPDAVIDPHAVMIEFHNAAIAEGAVLGASGLLHLACRTHHFGQIHALVVREHFVPLRRIVARDDAGLADGAQHEAQQIEAHRQRDDGRVDAPQRDVLSLSIYEEHDVSAVDQQQIDHLQHRIGFAKQVLKGQEEGVAQTMTKHATEGTTPQANEQREREIGVSCTWRRRRWRRCCSDDWLDQD